MQLQVDVVFNIVAQISVMTCSVGEVKAVYVNHQDVNSRVAGLY